MDPRTGHRPWTVPRVGLTGGVASGKSLVADRFQELGVPVIDTDRLARDLVEPGSPALADIIAAFGPGVLDPGGGLDRSRVRQMVFQDAARRRQLEAILHPRILARLEADARQAGGPYQVLVIPLLFESGLEGRVDRVLVVDCPESLQRERLARRDGADAGTIDGILGAQLGRDERVARARQGPHDILDNSGDPDTTRARVDALHRKYVALFAPGPGGGAE